MARGTPHGEQTKAAVLAALLAGQSVSEVARTYEISRDTVRAWRGAAGVGQAPVSHQKKAELGDLIAEYLRETIATLAVQARTARDEAWLKRQSAADFGVLHGILTDKAIRLLAALQAGDDADGAP